MYTICKEASVHLDGNIIRSAGNRFSIAHGLLSTESSVPFNAYMYVFEVNVSMPEYVHLCTYCSIANFKQSVRCAVRFNCLW